jgi:protein-disulfide isomerase
MIPIQVNRVRALGIVALVLACAPANGTKQAAESNATTRRDTAVVAATAAAAAAAADPDGKKADLARIQGNPSAPVWVIEVSDFQCPYCKQWHDQTYQQFRDEFVQTGKVRLAYINYPLSSHAHAWPAAEAAMCAGAQGKFWEMHDALFANQAKWEAVPAPAPVFDSLARVTGVDVARWQQCVQSGKMKAWIQADHDRAQAAGVNATPSFIIGETMLAGAQPIENLRSAVDTALAKSKKPTP